MKNEWHSFGDVNPLLYDGEWVRMIGEKQYQVVCVTPVDEKTIRITDSVVDLTDEWIDIDAIKKFTGDNGNDEYGIANDAVYYWGYIQFSGNEYDYNDESEVKKHLSDIGIFIE